MATTEVQTMIEPAAPQKVFAKRPGVEVKEEEPRAELVSTKRRLMTKYRHENAHYGTRHITMVFTHDKETGDVQFGANIYTPSQYKGDAPWKKKKHRKGAMGMFLKNPVRYRTRPEYNVDQVATSIRRKIASIKLRDNSQRERIFSNYYFDSNGIRFVMAVRKEPTPGCLEYGFTTCPVPKNEKTWRKGQQGFFEEEAQKTLYETPYVFKFNPMETFNVALTTLKKTILESYKEN